MGDLAEQIAERRSNLDPERQVGVVRRRMVGGVVVSLALLVGMGVVVLDGLGVVDAVGVDDDTVTATAPDGTTLEVRYPSVSRPALASPFAITVHRDGGFGDEPVTVTVDTAYLTMWDLNGVFPSPSEETADDRAVRWTFDPPPGDTLVITYEARIEPAAQTAHAGHVAVLTDADATGAGSELVAVDIRTRLRP